MSELGVKVISDMISLIIFFVKVCGPNIGPF